jgi:apolipoprotein N-acyltransferase
LTVARLALGLLSAFLLVVSFPPADLGFCAFAALVPVLFACRGLSTRAALVLAAVFGAVSAVGIYVWIFDVRGFGLAQSLFLGPYLTILPAATWCLALPRLSRDGGARLLLGAPALWVALDFLRAHAGFLAFSWCTLGQSQHADLPLLQVASIVGEQGVGFLVVLANVSLVLACDRRTRRLAGVGFGLLLAAHAAGALVLARPFPGPRLRLAAIQPCLTSADRDTPESRVASLDRLMRLTRQASAEPTDLVAWPETSVPGVAPGSPLAEGLQRLSAETGTFLLVGAAEREKFRPQAAASSAVADTRLSNTAHLFTPAGESGSPYKKMLLVPFAEYRPLEPAVRWPEWLAPRVFDVAAGTERRIFRLAGGAPFSVLICWESLFAPFVRSAVRDGAALLVHITNDGWFGRSAASSQHNQASILRAVENRVAVVIASNAGPSLIIDPRGRVVATGPGVFSQGFVAGDVSLAPGGTLYTRVGDVFAWACVAAALACLIARRESSRRSDPPLPAGRP